jgi:hypothetical protein
MSTTNVHELNPGLWGKRPATNRLSHGMAKWQYLEQIFIFTTNFLTYFYINTRISITVVLGGYNILYGGELFRSW